jgi:hypothetical protein
LLRSFGILQDVQSHPHQFLKIVQVGCSLVCVVCSYIKFFTYIYTYSRYFVCFILVLILVSINLILVGGWMFFSKMRRQRVQMQDDDVNELTPLQESFL